MSRRLLGNLAVATFKATQAAVDVITVRVLSVCPCVYLSV